MFSQEARLSKKLKAAKALPVLLMRDLGAPPKIFATDLITPLPSLTRFRHWQHFSPSILFFPLFFQPFPTLGCCTSALAVLQWERNEPIRRRFRIQKVGRVQHVRHPDPKSRTGSTRPSSGTHLTFSPFLAGKDIKGFEIMIQQVHLSVKPISNTRLIQWTLWAQRSLMPYITDYSSW